MSQVDTKHTENGDVWCPQCGAEYLPTMTTCSDCLVALVDEPPRERDPTLVPYDAKGWSEDLLVEFRYRLRQQGILFEEDRTYFGFRRDDTPAVNALIDELNQSVANPDAFVLPDGRRVKELPVGPPVENRYLWGPPRWAMLDWLIAVARDFVRRLTAR
jgi:hypothetical protein